MCSDANSTEIANQQASEAMTQTLQQDYAQTFSQNQKILGNLTTTLNNAIAKPQGFTSQQMAGLRTGATDTTTQQYNNAKVAAGASAARYGGDVASGVTGQIMGQVDAAEAGQQAHEQNTITQEDASLKQDNYWKGIQSLNGVAAAYNPNGYASNSIGSTNATTSASQEIQSEENAGWQHAAGIVSGIGGLASSAAMM